MRPSFPQWAFAAPARRQTLHACSPVPLKSPFLGSSFHFLIVITSLRWHSVCVTMQDSHGEAGDKVDASACHHQQLAAYGPLPSPACSPPFASAGTPAPSSTTAQAPPAAVAAFAPALHSATVCKGWSALAAALWKSFAASCRGAAASAPCCNAPPAPCSSTPTAACGDDPAPPAPCSNETAATCEDNPAAAAAPFTDGSAALCPPCCCPAPAQTHEPWPAAAIAVLVPTAGHGNGQPHATGSSWAVVQSLSPAPHAARPSAQAWLYAICAAPAGTTGTAACTHAGAGSRPGTVTVSGSC